LDSKHNFWDDKVCIDDQIYKNNEILTAYLNLDCSELDFYLIHLRDDKCKTDPIWIPYNRAYKAHVRYLKKETTTAQFEQWSRYAFELREQAESGTLEQAEYERLLKI